MSRRPLVRSPLAFAAIVAAVFLAGCNPDGMREVNGRHMQPLSGKMLAEIESKNMEKESPILVRIFKQESEFEVWKEDKTGRLDGAANGKRPPSGVACRRGSGSCSPAPCCSF